MAQLPEYKSRLNYVWQNLNLTLKAFAAKLSPYLGGGGGLAGTNYITVSAAGTPAENGTALLDAYTAAQGMSPSATNEITILLAPGYYGLSQKLLLNTPYIYISSLTSNQDVILDRIDLVDPFFADPISGEITEFGEVVKITADNVKLIGIVGATRISIEYDNYWGNGTTYILPIRLINNLPYVYVENCTAGPFSFGSNENWFGILSEPVTVSGTFVDCTADFRSFGSFGDATGTFINCTSTFEQSFAYSSTGSGYFENCKAPAGYSFGSSSTSIESGTFVNCSAGAYSFGANGTASGNFYTCISGDRGFGSNTGIASGNFYNCIAGFASFGTAGSMTGVAHQCIGGEYSFGSFGALTGSLYYCKLTVGTFPVVSGSGVTRYCIDGNNATNNQG